MAPGCALTNIEPQTASAPDIAESSSPAGDEGAHVAWAACLETRIKANDAVALEQGLGIGLGVLGLGAAGISTALASREGVSDAQTTQWAVAAAGGLALTAVAVYLLTKAGEDRKSLAEANAGCPPPKRDAAATAITTAVPAKDQATAPDRPYPETWGGARITQMADKWKIPILVVEVGPPAESRDELERMYAKYEDTGLAQKKTTDSGVRYSFVLAETEYGRKLKAELEVLKKPFVAAPAGADAAPTGADGGTEVPLPANR